MKLIDLFVKIANGEKVPNIIKFDNMIFRTKEKNITIIVKEENKLLEESFIFEELNEEVEIIERYTKENKKIEDISRFQYSQIPSWFDIKDVIKAVNENFENHQQALYEIIDKINGE